jgi:dihydrofolate reductase
MKKVILWMSISVAGCFAGPDRDLSWHRVDDELHQHMNDRLAAMSAFLHGRVMYELMADVWPTADQDPSIGGPMAEFAPIWRDMPKIVYSRTLERADWNTTIVRDVVADDVRRLKDGPGGDLVLGGADIAATFRRLDLIDEYRLYVHPIILGAGRPLFPESGQTTDLRLVDTQRFGNGVVALHYAR